MELTNGEPPSLMQQLQLLRDQEVRAEMLKLSEIMKEEKINLKAEDVSFLMQGLKAQMDGEGGKNWVSEIDISASQLLQKMCMPSPFFV